MRAPEVRAACGLVAMTDVAALNVCLESAAAIFASDMWHYTSSASVGTIKLALFYALTRTNGRSVHFASSADAPIATACDRTAGPSAQRLSVAHRKGSRSSTHGSSASKMHTQSDSCADKKMIDDPIAHLPLKKRPRHE